MSPDRDGGDTTAAAPNPNPYSDLWKYFKRNAPPTFTHASSDFPAPTFSQVLRNQKRKLIHSQTLSHQRLQRFVCLFVCFTGLTVVFIYQIDIINKCVDVSINYSALSWSSRIIFQLGKLKKYSFKSEDLAQLGRYGIKRYFGRKLA